MIYQLLKKTIIIIQLLNLVLIKILIDYWIEKLFKSKKYLALKHTLIFLKLAFTDI